MAYNPYNGQNCFQGADVPQGWSPSLIPDGRNGTFLAMVNGFYHNAYRGFASGNPGQGQGNTATGSPFPGSGLLLMDRCRMRI